MMNSEMNIPLEPSGAVGYLVVQVTTGNTAIPLQGALVTIRRDEPENSDVLYELTSGSDGRTPKITLPTMSREDSQQPETTRPFTTYIVQVAMPGFESAEYQNVPIFEGITSLQGANLQPTPENGTPDSFTVRGPQIFETTNPEL